MCVQLIPIPDIDVGSVGFRTNEALCWLSYEAPYLGPEGGRPSEPTHIHAQEILKFKIAPHKQKSIVKNILAGRWAPLTNGPCA